MRGRLLYAVAFVFMAIFLFLAFSDIMPGWMSGAIGVILLIGVVAFGRGKTPRRD